MATFALQFAVAVRADVWVTSSKPQKIERAVELGAKGGFDYTDEDWAKRLGKEAGAPNLIIDSAGGAGYRSLVNLAAPGGRIVNIRRDGRSAREAGPLQGLLETASPARFNNGISE